MFVSEFLSIESNGRMTSALPFVVLFHVALPLFAIAVALIRAKRDRMLGERSRREYVAASPLVGGRQAVFGAVEYEPGFDHAVTVTVEQQGEERQNKGNWSHTWTEISRSTRAVPFYVNDVRGRVRVEPDERTLLVDKLDEVRRNGVRRVRVARLAPKEMVFVSGNLQVSGRAGVPANAYRAPAETYVMRPPPKGRLLCSTEPLDSRFLHSSGQQRGFAFAFAVVFGFFALIDAGFYLRLAAGVRETATVLETKRITGKSSRCALELETASGDRFSDDVASSWCGRLTKGSVVSVVNPKMGGWFAHVGTTPALNTAAVIVGLLFFLGVGATYVWRNRPWYESPVIDNGMGKL